MSLGTKNRQQQTAQVCKHHLWEKNQNNLGLVNEFIAEIERTGKTMMLTIGNSLQTLPGK